MCIMINAPSMTTVSGKSCQDYLNIRHAQLPIRIEPSFNSRVILAANQAYLSREIDTIQVQRPTPL